jgi:hypothetical protein
VLSLEGVLGVALGVGVAALLMWIADLIVPRVWKYRVDHEGVAYVFLNRFEWWRIPHEQIAWAEVKSYLDLLLDDSLRGFKVSTRPNRMFGWLHVVVRRTNGRYLVLTPSDPYGFVRAVNERRPWPATNALGEGGQPALGPAAPDQTLPASASKVTADQQRK